MRPADAGQCISNGVYGVHPFNGSEAVQSVTNHQPAVIRTIAFPSSSKTKALELSQPQGLASSRRNSQQPVLSNQNVISGTIGCITSSQRGASAD
jgi:hypothetical protein